MKFKTVAKAIAILALTSLMRSALLMLFWNLVMPYIGVPRLNLLRAMAMFMLVASLPFNNFSLQSRE